MNISDKVVCVDASPKAGLNYDGYSYPDGWITEGSVYVVVGFYADPSGTGLRLAGKRSLGPKGNDGGWFAWRFRLLSEVQAEAKSARLEPSCH